MRTGSGMSVAVPDGSEVIAIAWAAADGAREIYAYSLTDGSLIGSNTGVGATGSFDVPRLLSNAGGSQASPSIIAEAGALDFVVSDSERTNLVNAS